MHLHSAYIHMCLDAHMSILSQLKSSVIVLLVCIFLHFVIAMQLCVHYIMCVL